MNTSESQAEKMSNFVCVRCNIERAFKEGSEIGLSLCNKWLSTAELLKQRQAKLSKLQKKWKKEQRDLAKKNQEADAAAARYQSLSKMFNVEWVEEDVKKKKSKEDKKMKKEAAKRKEEAKKMQIEENTENAPSTENIVGAAKADKEKEVVAGNVGGHAPVRKPATSLCAQMGEVTAKITVFCNPSAFFH